MGNLSVISTNEKCRSWSDLPPGKPTIKDAYFPDGSIASARNYCRNPINHKQGPWCYCSQSKTRSMLCRCFVPCCDRKICWDVSGALLKCAKTEIEIIFENFVNILYLAINLLLTRSTKWECK